MSWPSYEPICGSGMQHHQELYDNTCPQKKLTLHLLVELCTFLHSCTRHVAGSHRITLSPSSRDSKCIKLQQPGGMALKRIWNILLCSKRIHNPEQMVMDRQLANRLVNEAKEGWGQSWGQKVWGQGQDQKFSVRPRPKYMRPRPQSLMNHETLLI